MIDDLDRGAFYRWKGYEEHWNPIPKDCFIEDNLKQTVEELSKYCFNERDGWECTKEDWIFDG